MQEQDQAQDKQWYIVQTYSGHENKAKAALEERISQQGMEHDFEEIFIPMETVVEMRDGKRREVTKKFYNGYIFVKMNLNDKSWHTVKNTPKIVGFLGGNPREPQPVPESEVKQITQRIEEGKMAPDVQVHFERGQKVRITEGHFKDFNGWVEEVDQEKGKLKVMVEIFGRPTRKPFDFNEVEAVEE